MNDETVIREVRSGEQNHCVEEGLKILGQPPASLVWVFDPENQPIWITGNQLGQPNLSGSYMIPVWTRKAQLKQLLAMTDLELDQLAKELGVEFDWTAGWFCPRFSLIKLIEEVQRCDK